MEIEIQFRAVYQRVYFEKMEEVKSGDKSMVEGGFARFVYVNSPQYESLKQASQIVKAGKVGIYSPTCLSTVSETNCDIKGNIHSGKKIYHLAECRILMSSLTLPSATAGFVLNRKLSMKAFIKPEIVRIACLASLCYNSLCPDAISG